MNEKDLKSRLNAELSNVTWTVRDSNAVRRRVNQGGMKKMKHSFVAIFAMILLLVFMATAAAAAISEDFNAWLYQLWPDAALKLMPVNMSCEDSGIRMEVMSAVVNQEEMYITFSLQDLEGDRIDKNTEVLIDANDDFYAGVSGGVAYDTPAPLYAEDGNKYIFAEHITLQGGLRMRVSGEKVKLSVNGLRSNLRRTIDLVPVYREFAAQAKGMPVPDNAEVYAGYNRDGEAFYGTGEGMSPIPEGMQVLDSTCGPEIPLADGHAYLSGIGMVDGLLHVQVHFVDNREYEVGGAFVDVYIEGNDGAYRRYIDRDKLPDGICGLVWGTRAEDGIEWDEKWEEIIFTLPENEQVGDQTLAVNVEITGEEIAGNWEVEIPVRLIREEK